MIAVSRSEGWTARRRIARLQISVVSGIGTRTASAAAPRGSRACARSIGDHLAAPNLGRAVHHSCERRDKGRADRRQAGGPAFRRLPKWPRARVPVRRRGPPSKDAPRKTRGGGAKRDACNPLKRQIIAVQSSPRWHRRTTPQKTSPFSRGSNRSENAPACTSAASARPDCTTSSGRCSTTRSTRR